MTPSRRPRRLLPAAAALLAAVIALVVLTRAENPHALDAQSSVALTAREEGGETLANAMIYMHNRSDEPIVLESARIIATGKVPEFRFLVAGPDRTDDVQGGEDEECPPDFFKHPSIKSLRGFTLQPDSTPAGEQGAVLIFCYRVPPAPARLRITEAEVTYRQDGELRTLRFPNRYSLCVAPEARCDPGDTL